jgi:hypothetical protein
LPRWSRMLGSAPPCSSSSATSASPLAQATWSAVRPAAQACACESEGVCVSVCVCGGVHLVPFCCRQLRAAPEVLLAGPARGGAGYLVPEAVCSAHLDYQMQPISARAPGSMKSARHTQACSRPPAESTFMSRAAKLLLNPAHRRSRLCLGPAPGPG